MRQGQSGGRGGVVCWLPSFFLVLGSEWSGSILFFCNGGMKKIFLEVMVTDER